MKQVYILLFIAVIPFAFYQCQADEIVEVPIESAKPLTGDVVEVNQNITDDVTWTAGNTYILNDLIYVTESASLTIESCVLIKATSGATGLVIDKGAKLFAEGTVDCPIIFTSTEDLLEAGSIVSPNLTGEDVGLWGGVFILGDAPVSSVNSPAVLPLLADGFSSEFGGNAENDDSGILQYVSIRHTGFETTTDETPCGLTLAGVGSGTTIDKVELYANVDDGFLMIGGTANVSNVITSYFEDDGVDVDKGYAGIIDNLIGIGGTNRNSTLELDGGEGAENPRFTIRNASFKGSQSGESYIDFQRNVNCLIENAYFFGFDADAQVLLDRDNDAENWLAERVDVGNLEFNTSHLTTGNMEIETIFFDAGANGNDAFTVRAPDARIVTNPSTGASKSSFEDWSVAHLTGLLDDF